MLYVGERTKQRPGMRVGVGMYSPSGCTCLLGRKTALDIVRRAMAMVCLFDR